MNIYKTTPAQDIEYLKEHCQAEITKFPENAEFAPHANYIRKLQSENMLYNITLKICQISAILLGVSFVFAALFGTLWKLLFPDSDLISSLFAGNCFLFMGSFVLVILTAIIGAPLEKRIKAFELEDNSSVFLLDSGEIAIICAPHSDTPVYQFITPVIFDWTKAKTMPPEKLPFCEWEKIKKVRQYTANEKGNFVIIADVERYYVDFMASRQDDYGYDYDSEFSKRYYYKKQNLKKAYRVLRCDNYFYVVQEALEKLKK